VDFVKISALIERGEGQIPELRNVVLGSRKVFLLLNGNLLSIDRGLLADYSGLGGKKNQSMILPSR
jgi:hypothetical protein